jgi:hypothetical protein
MLRSLFVDFNAYFAWVAQQINPRQRARDRSRLLAAVDQMIKTFGKNAVYFATSQNALNHAPMRIAFSRIPDIEPER